MKASLRSILGALLLAALAPAAAPAAVPHLISYQGKLVDAAGAPVPNGDYSVTFRIYDAPAGGALLWDEVQTVTVTSGLFTALLGSVDPLNLPFDDDYYLALRVAGDAEMTPRQRMASVGTAYRAETAEVALSADPPDTVTGTGTAKAVLTAINSAGGTGLRGEGHSASDDSCYGVYGYAASTNPGPFNWSNAYGLYGSAYHSDFIPGDAYGVFGTATGPFAYGGYFYVPDLSESGEMAGVLGWALGSGTTELIGVAGYTGNQESGDSYGGYFLSSSGGSGRDFGIYSRGAGAGADTMFGVYASASNTSTGQAIAGYFTTNDDGSGSHHGVRAVGLGSSTSAVRGVYSSASNTGSGLATAGLFTASSSGTGTHYGVFGQETAGGGGAAVYASGDFAGSGAKYAVTRTSRGHRLLSVIESPEVWFEDFGEGDLTNGRSHIELDPLFLETVTIDDAHPMKVFIQLNDPDCKGTAVLRGRTGFDVVEIGNGTSNASFSYRAVAKRKGYEDERLRETDVGYNDPVLYPELQAEMEREFREEMQQQGALSERSQQKYERLPEQSRRPDREPPLRPVNE